MDTELERLKDLRDLERVMQDKVMKTAVTVDLEAHRLLEVVRESYCRGDLRLLDTGDALRSMEETAELLRRLRKSFDRQ